MELASLVLRAFPDELPRIQESVLAISGTEIPCVDPNGRLVVVVEHDCHRDLTHAITEIEKIDRLLSVSMVFQYSDEVQETKS